MCKLKKVSNADPPREPGDSGSDDEDAGQPAAQVCRLRPQGVFWQACQLSACTAAPDVPACACSASHLCRELQCVICAELAALALRVAAWQHGSASLCSLVQGCREKQLLSDKQLAADLCGERERERE